MERTSSKLILLLVILTSVFAVMGYVLLGDHKDTTMENGSRISEKDQPQSLSVPSTKLAKTSKEASDKQALYTASDEEILYAKDVTVVFKQFEDLRKHPSPEAVNILSGFLNHENGVVVAEAIDTLGFIGLNFLFVIIAETISGNLNLLFSDISSDPLIILLIFFVTN